MRAAKSLYGLNKVEGGGTDERCHEEHRPRFVSLCTAIKTPPVILVATPRCRTIVKGKASDHEIKLHGGRNIPNARSHWQRHLTISPKLSDHRAGVLGSPDPVVWLDQIESIYWLRFHYSSSTLRTDHLDPASNRYLPRTAAYTEIVDLRAYLTNFPIISIHTHSVVVQSTKFYHPIPYTQPQSW